MTFSIVATDRQAWGVAVASKFLGVGAAVPAAAAGVGAIATQSWANLAYRPDRLALLQAGKTAQQTLDALTSADEHREERQAGIVTAMALEGELATEVRDRLRRLGHDDASLDKALADWAGIENYEERLLPGAIDPIVLDQLRKAAS